MNSWLSQIAESAIRDHASFGTDLRSAKDFQSTFEQLAEDMKVCFTAAANYSLKDSFTAS